MTPIILGGGYTVNILLRAGSSTQQNEGNPNQVECNNAKRYLFKGYKKTKMIE